MDDSHLIYVDRLTDERIEKINCQLTPEFIDVQEKDLSYPDPVQAQGEAYVASDHLVVHLDVSTTALLPCKTCNEPLKKNVSLHHVYHTIPLSDLKHAIFDIRDILRENILIESPQFAECDDNNCPHRVQFSEFLQKGDTVTKVDTDEHSNFPFAHLDEEINKS